MARPCRCRRIKKFPDHWSFSCEDGEREDGIAMSLDEYETIRLIDREGFSQEACGEYMRIARTTVQQVYTTARKKLADALVEGAAIRIEGGHYELCDGKESDCGCGGCEAHRKPADA